MKATLLHPLAAQHTPRALDVIYGGNEHDTINESAKLAFDTVKYLPKEQHVLYVNTLIDHRSFERVLHKFASRRPRLLYMTWLESSFMERLETLEHIISTKQVGALVINSFEFAALTQRHRVELGQWLRRVRNMFQIRIVLFMQCKPGYYGVNGSLRFAASNIVEVGASLKKQSSELSFDQIQQETAIAEDFAKENQLEEEVTAELETGLEEEAEAEEVIAEYSDERDEESFLDEDSVDEEDSWLDPAQRVSLKNKELAYADVA